MNLFETIGNYFIIKDNMIKYISIIFFLSCFVWNCAGTEFQQLAENDPVSLIAMEDSLVSRGLTPDIALALVMAYNSVGEEEMNQKNYNSAVEKFTSAVSLLKTDTLSNYNLSMAKGHVLYAKGKKDGLWDAIQNYHHAARLLPMNGEPHYRIGKAYLKIGNTDFDLILESYDKALSLELPVHLRNNAMSDKEIALKRESTLKNFWK
jgi:tetratricopeptide (TPR) repeat protein